MDIYIECGYYVEIYVSEVMLAESPACWLSW